MLSFTKGILFIIFSYILIWIQAYGPSKITFIKSNNWIIYVTAIIITYFFSKGTETLLLTFKDTLWSVKVVTFSINMFVFTLMTYFITGEGFNIKNIICLLLAVVIVLIQVFWK